LLSVEVAPWDTVEHKNMVHQYRHILFAAVPAAPRSSPHAAAASRCCRLLLLLLLLLPFAAVASRCCHLLLLPLAAAAAIQVAHLSSAASLLL
jgi:hypothetical protein